MSFGVVRALAIASFSLQTVRISDVLYEEVIEVHERAVLVQSSCQLNDSIRGKIERKTTTIGEQASEHGEILISVATIASRLKYGNRSTKINCVRI